MNKCQNLFTLLDEMFFNTDQPEDNLKMLAQKALQLHNKGLICPHLIANLLCIANSVFDSEKREIAFNKYKDRVNGNSNWR